MKRNLLPAFTLAEILTTLAIIGVVAAVSIPQLAVGVQKNKDAAVIGRNVQILENGCGIMINEVNAKSVNNTFHLGHSDVRVLEAVASKGTSSTIDGAVLKHFMRGRDLLEYNPHFDNVKLSDSDAANYKNSMKEYGGAASDVYSNFDIFVNERLGSYLAGITVPEAQIDSSEEDPITDLILIDANGAQIPNRYGKDIFLFGLTDRCRVIPAGTEQMRVIGAGMNNTTFNVAQSVGCGTTNNRSITKGLTCTLRLVRDGFKIKYF